MDYVVEFGETSRSYIDRVEQLRNEKHSPDCLKCARNWSLNLPRLKTAAMTGQRGKRAEGASDKGTPGKDGKIDDSVQT